MTDSFATAKNILHINPPITGLNTDCTCDNTQVRIELTLYCKDIEEQSKIINLFYDHLIKKFQDGDM